MNTEFTQAIVMVQVPAAEAHLRAKAALYRATEHLELVWRKVVQSEIKRRRANNRRLLPTLLPWLRTTVDAHAVRAELERVMAAQPERAARSSWWTAQTLQRNRARVAQAVLAEAHAARSRGETHIRVPRGEWAWLDPTHRGESTTNHDETRMLLRRKI